MTHEEYTTKCNLLIDRVKKDGNMPEVTALTEEFAKLVKRSHGIITEEVGVHCLEAAIEALACPTIKRALRYNK